MDKYAKLAAKVLEIRFGKDRVARWRNFLKDAYKALKMLYHTRVKHPPAATFDVHDPVADRMEQVETPSDEEMDKIELYRTESGQYFTPTMLNDGLDCPVCNATGEKDGKECPECCGKKRVPIFKTVEKIYTATTIKDSDIDELLETLEAMSLDCDLDEGEKTLMKLLKERSRQKWL